MTSARKQFSAALLGVFLMSFSGTARADAIGLSQSTTEPTIYKGDVLEETIVFTRSPTDEDTLLIIEQEGTDLIDLQGQEQVMLSAGSDSQSFSFVIDASEAEVGEYEGKLRFILDDPELGEDAPEGASVRYGLTALYRIAVVERPDPSVTLAVSDYPTLIDDIYVSSLDVDQAFVAGGKQLNIAWMLSNDGQNPVSQVVSSVTVMRRGMTFYQGTHVSSDAIPASGDLERSTSFLLSDQYPSGRYQVIVKVGDDEVKKSVWIVHVPLLWSLFALSIGAAASIVTLVLLKQNRHVLRRRSVRR